MQIDFEDTIPLIVIAEATSTCGCGCDCGPDCPPDCC